MLKDLSERQKILIIFIAALVVAIPFAVLQIISLKSKISELDFSDPPFSNMETSPMGSEIEERMRSLEEGLEEREEELKNLEELNNEE